MATVPGTRTSAAEAVATGFKGNRWWILSLLFVATTINYLDRAILGVLLPEIRNDLQFSQEAYGNIQFWFQFAYGIGSLIGGKLLDTYGTRIGYGMAATLWSLAGTLHAFASSVTHFSVLRLVLGFGEAPNFPACNKAIAEWFPPSQKALAMGVVNFGTNFANIIGPGLFVWIATTWSWQAGFAVMGLLGFLWVPLWLTTARVPGHVEAAPKGSSLSIRAVLKYKQAWGFALAKGLTDPVWWFYLFWLPTYLTDFRGMTPGERATALTVVYAISGAGALAGGAASSYLMRIGWAVGPARKTTMAVCALIMPFSALGMVVESTQLAVLLFGLGTAAHQAWMSNLFTVPADVFPKQAVGSVNGFGVFMGAMGGALFSGLIPGRLLPVLGYAPILISMSCFYLLAWFLVHKLMGDLSPVGRTSTSD
jgi:ACS family hexuronate transporter-like MFS transporter